MPSNIWTMSCPFVGFFIFYFFLFLLLIYSAIDISERPVFTRKTDADKKLTEWPFPLCIEKCSASLGVHCTVFKKWNLNKKLLRAVKACNQLFILNYVSKNNKIFELVIENEKIAYLIWNIAHRFLFCINGVLCKQLRLEHCITINIQDEWKIKIKIKI